MEWFTFILVAFFFVFSIRAATAVNCPWIKVDPSGAGNFVTIQAAINSVPSNNKAWICIYVKAGVYKEQVLIPYDKPFIYLQGEGERNTNVVWDATIQTSAGATFTAQADYLVVRRIAFTNSYNYPTGSSGNKIKQAVAALLQGDKLAFYECGFYGIQDTLWDCQGRHYFQFCTIKGAIDFIFGSGQSIYEKCSISVAAGVLEGPGFITAQGRSTPDEPNGFVFKNCMITGDGKTYLGRAWRPYARVIFYNTIMDGTIVPLGWDAWQSIGKESKLSFDEIQCGGSGADKTQRVNWANKKSFSKLQKFIDISYIDGSSWIFSP